MILITRIDPLTKFSLKTIFMFLNICSRVSVFYFIYTIVISTHFLRKNINFLRWFDYYFIFLDEKAAKLSNIFLAVKVRIIKVLRQNK